MRTWPVPFFVLLSACATAGVSDEATSPSGDDDDSGTVTAKDAATTFGNDASPTQTKDGGTQTQDSGGTQTLDAGNNNNGCTSFQGTLASFDFTGEPGNQTSTAASSAATGVAASAIARASTLTATSGQDSMNSSAWGTGAKLDTTRYYTFSLTPTAPCTLDVASLSISTKASGTGPSSAAVATSDDSFAKATTFAPNVIATPSVSVNGATGAIEIRVYGYDASGTGGTFRVDTTLTVTGSLQ